MLNIIGNKKIYYVISGIFVLASVAALILWRLELGIDFTGGSILEVAYMSEERPEVNSVYASLIKLNNLKISPVGSDGLALRFKETDEETHQKIMAVLNPVEERRFSSIGPTIGTEIKKK